MTPKWTIRKGILDAFADDIESIIQVEEYLKHLNIPNSRKEIKDIFVKMLEKELIVIVYPDEKGKNDFINSDDNSLDEYWFELTSIGRIEWEKIECDD